MSDPAGLAIDEENRFLYVANTGTDQILVYDADTFKLLRKIGTAGKARTLTDPGDFAAPTNVAVDKDGNLFVADTLNDRVEVFDADGVFVPPRSARTATVRAISRVPRALRSIVTATSG